MSGVILAAGGVIEACEGARDVMQRVYKHEEHHQTGMWALCPVCERWYQGPAGVPVPYEHTKDGWITESDDDVGIVINRIWPNYSIPAGQWRGAHAAWHNLRVIGLAAGATEPIKGMPGAPGSPIRTEEVPANQAVDPRRFAQATGRGIQKTRQKITKAAQVAKRVEERNRNRRRHGR